MTPLWRKSSHSGTGQGGQSDCIEVAALDEGIALRDSKAPESGRLSLSTTSFAALLNRIKHDRPRL